MTKSQLFSMCFQKHFLHKFLKTHCKTFETFENTRFCLDFSKKQRKTLGHRKNQGKNNNKSFFFKFEIKMIYINSKFIQVQIDRKTVLVFKISRYN